jgi:hypothetical protein
MARWKLGRALAAVEREPEGGDRRATTRKVSSGFWKWPKESLGLHPETVTDAQRSGLGVMRFLTAHQFASGDAALDLGTDLLRCGEFGLRASNETACPICRLRPPLPAWRAVR